jgi:hypothetical protein
MQNRINLNRHLFDRLGDLVVEINETQPKAEGPKLQLSYTDNECDLRLMCGGDEVLQTNDITKVTRAVLGIAFRRAHERKLPLSALDFHDAKLYLMATKEATAKRLPCGDHWYRLTKEGDGYILKTHCAGAELGDMPLPSWADVVNACAAIDEVISDYLEHHGNPTAQAAAIIKSIIDSIMSIGRKENDDDTTE